MKGLLPRSVLFLSLTVGFIAGVACVQPVLFHFSQLLPDNYRFIATEAMRAGNPARAEAIANRRIAKTYYDFEAHYVLAEALAGQKKYDEAVEVLKLVLRKLPAARSKKEQVLGYDEARTYSLLAKYLWSGHRYFEAGEMARAAIDCGTPVTARETAAAFGVAGASLKSGANPDESLALARVGLKLKAKAEFNGALAALDGQTSASRAEGAILSGLWTELYDADTTAAENKYRQAAASYVDEPAVKLALANFLQRHHCDEEATSLTGEIAKLPGTRPIGPGLFVLPTGGSAGTTFTMLRQNGTARADFNTGVYKVTRLLMNARGKSALGVFPILVVSSGGKEVTRLYLDSPQPHLYNLNIWPEGAPKMLDLRFEFINDVYDPYSKADRNVELSDMFLY
ncbi:MAG: hypothetical protein K1X53_08990 [Candidatus Sumerlaeaceae bacterium]|nr:hypothetical protein [Candidatus Sumerlaeaceae bacterium]